MFAPDVAALLESGCALIVGTVSADGKPQATRGWGLAIGPDAPSVRLLLDGENRVALENLSATGFIAVTGCDVPTLRSVQLKGRADAPIATTEAADLELADRFRQDFFGNVSRTEGTPVEVLERMLPASLAVCTVTVEEVYDQTPGPVAGSPLSRTS